MIIDFGYILKTFVWVLVDVLVKLARMICGVGLLWLFALRMIEQGLVINMFVFNMAFVGVILWGLDVKGMIERW